MCSVGPHPTSSTQVPECLGDGGCQLSLKDQATSLKRAPELGLHLHLSCHDSASALGATGWLKAFKHR